MSASVSILLPSYNHGRFLPYCLESVLAQDFQDWELIVIDDGSTDDSVAILKSFKDPRIQVHQNQANLGTYGTLDKAVSMSNGEFISILNSDDAWDPTKLTAEIEALSRQPQAPFAYCLGYRIDENNQRLEDVFGSTKWPTTASQELLPYLLDRNDVLASSVVFRRGFARFQPELRYSGDWVALLNAAKLAPAAFVDRPLSAWRMHESNTFRRSPAQVQEEVLVRESILNKPRSWMLPRLSSQSVKHGIAACAMHLSALYVLQGRIGEARQMARAAVRFEPGKASLRRLAVVTMPLEKARRYLWKGEAGIASAGKRPLINFF